MKVGIVLGNISICIRVMKISKLGKMKNVH